MDACPFFFPIHDVQLIASSLVSVGVPFFPDARIAQRVLPIPSTKPQHMAFADLYGTEDEEAKFSSENVARGGGVP